MLFINKEVLKRFYDFTVHEVYAKVASLKWRGKISIENKGLSNKEKALCTLPIIKPHLSIRREGSIDN